MSTGTDVEVHPPNLHEDEEGVKAAETIPVVR
jgi:hypothetical protein